MINLVSFSPRSLQLYHLSFEGGRCEVLPPEPRLRTCIDYCWWLTVTTKSLVLDVIPDTGFDLVLSPDVDGFAQIYCPVADRHRIVIEGPVRYAGVSFRSDAVGRALGHSAERLRTLAAGSSTLDLLQLRKLAGDLKGVESLSAFSVLVEREWLERLGAEPAAGEASRIDPPDVLAALESSIGNDRIRTVCARLGVSERQFRRLSRELFGLSPKKLARVVRLQRALSELVAANSEPDQDLYYDDSHRIREIKQLTGLTPGLIRRLAETYNRS